MPCDLGVLVDFEPVAGGTVCANGAIVAAKKEFERAMHAVFEREDFQIEIGIFDFLSVSFNDREPFKAHFPHRYNTIDD